MTASNRSGISDNVGGFQNPGVVCNRFLPSSPPPTLSCFALAPFFTRLKLRKSRSSDLFCSETPGKRLLRRLHKVLLSAPCTIYNVQNNNNVNKFQPLQPLQPFKGFAVGKGVGDGVTCIDRHLSYGAFLPLKLIIMSRFLGGSFRPNHFRYTFRCGFITCILVV